MKKQQTKSFTFKVAEKTESKQKQFKARDGVSLAGCTLTQFWWGREPTANPFNGWHGDGNFFC